MNRYRSLTLLTILHTKDIVMSDTTKETPASTADDNMGYPKAPETTLPETSAAKDTQTIINEAVKEVTVDEKGKYVYPENMDPMLKAAVAATKSYRDNQSGFTKSQQSLKEAEAERDALREKLATHAVQPLELSTADQTELDKLYVDNPDAWRAKMNKLELESKQAIQTELDTVTEEVRTKAGDKYELERRYEYLDKFNEGREIPITPEILDTDVPPRITKQLAEGKITFENYLDEVSEYLLKGKVVGGAKAEVTTDLNKSGGSSAPIAPKEGEIDYSQQVL